MKFRWEIGMVTLLMISILAGCSQVELEENSFPMLVAVGSDDRKVTFDVAFPKLEKKDSTLVKKSSFEKCIVEYESRLSKQADYNHLKVFVLEEELIKEKEAYNEMLAYLAKTERFPRNTYVCVVNDIEDLFELEEHISQDLGTYLEEYITKHEEEKSHILTLGDLLDERENQTLILYLPYLEVEENYVEWDGYVNILGEIWQDF